MTAISALGSLLLFSFCFAAVQPTSAKKPNCCAVQQDQLWQKQVPPGLSATTAARISPLFNYSFLLPWQQLRRTTTYAGASVRLRKFLTDLLDGRRPLRVGAVGGSITVGKAAHTVEDSWFGIVTSWLASVARQNITFRNGAIGGTPNAYMALCAHYALSAPDFDLVFVEYEMNDGQYGVDNPLLKNDVVLSMERLLRRVLGMPTHPAAIMVESPIIGLSSILPYYQTHEYGQRANEAYYDVSAVSPHNGLHMTINVDRDPAFPHAAVYDGNHPGDAGHKIYADCIVHLIQETALNLVQQPLTEAELVVAAQPLPSPIWPGNEPASPQSCSIGPDFQALMLSARGFSWTNEGTASHPAWGYVATIIGSKLTFQIDTVRAHRPPNATICVYVYIQRVPWVFSGGASGPKMEMGMARLECEAGCNCLAVEADGYTDDAKAFFFPVPLLATQAHACRIRVTVLDRSRGGGHKVKVFGVVVSEQETEGGKLKFGQLNFGMLFHHPELRSETSSW